METVPQHNDINAKLHLSRWQQVQKRSTLLTLLSGTGAKGQKSERGVWQTAKDKAVVMAGGDKNLTLCRFWQVCVILSMQGKGRKITKGTCSNTEKLFSLSDSSCAILLVHFNLPLS